MPGPGSIRQPARCSRIASARRVRSSSLSWRRMPRMDVLVPELGLQGACVMALVRRREAAGVAEPVRMYLERQPCGSTGAHDRASEPGSRERRAALRGANGDRGSFSRCRRRSARSSSPMIGCVAGVPSLTRRTCKVADASRPAPIDDRRARWTEGLAGDKQHRGISAAMAVGHRAVLIKKEWCERRAASPLNGCHRASPR